MTTYLDSRFVDAYADLAPQSAAEYRQLAERRHSLIAEANEMTQKMQDADRKIGNAFYSDQPSEAAAAEYHHYADRAAALYVHADKLAAQAKVFEKEIMDAARAQGITDMGD